VIFDTWLDMPVWGIFGVLAGLFAASAALIHWLSFGDRIRPRSSTLGGVVAPFFGSVAVLFSLLTGFLANDVWDRNRQASRDVMAERDGLLALHAISLAAVPGLNDVRAAALRYAQALVQDEWPRMTDQESSDKAGTELQSLLGRVADPQIGAQAGQAAQGALLDTVLRLRSTRDDRLSLIGDRSDRTKWAAVVILGLITQIAVGIVHLDKPRAQLAALTIFSAAAVATLGLIAIRERPFDGPAHVSPAPVQAALRSLAEAARP
jgi:hypothetical protein